MKYFLIIIIIASPLFVHAQTLDTDNDGLLDDDEIVIFRTDPNKADTDGDGFPDGEEVKNGFSPLRAGRVLLSNIDSDSDGLSDLLEYKYRTNIFNPDTDGDGFKDGQEVGLGYKPNSEVKGQKMKKLIAIDIKQQELVYSNDGVVLGTHRISSGKNNSTPKGKFKIINKQPKAWSKYGLWMPYWMGLGTGRFGIHELPIWPSGKREGESHLGKPVSHGCIRLGTKVAKKVYDWAEVGTEVVIK